MTPKQMSLSMQHDAGFERHRKPTRRDVHFLQQWYALSDPAVEANSKESGLNLQ